MSLKQVLGDFQAHLEAKANSADYVEQCINRLERAFAVCSFKKLDDLRTDTAADAFSRFIRDLTTQKGPKGKPPFILLPSRSAKNREETPQPITDALAKLLRPYLRGIDGPVWPGGWSETAAEMLRVDLAAAGIPFETPEGVLDFHALRTSFITNLARAGVHPRIAQQLARHSDINLTMHVYTKMGLDDLAQALNGT